MHPEELAKTIDHTLLRANATSADVEALCAEAARYHFATVCLFPHFVPLAAGLLRGSDVRACTVISFPFGADTPGVKALSAAEAVSRGADEVDVVINVPAFLSGESDVVRDELAGIVSATRGSGADKERGRAIVKAIIETCYLDEKQKRLACRICEQAGVDFVKTSTGLGPKGATVEDVELLRDCLDERIGIKASGGIRTAADLERMVSAGADRVGTSAGVAIMKERLA
ncbi:MAG: deoxyribose-phosphate aldolase [Thermoleophilia bacterium]|nr:deoxyribose-phosphate aldolase [Thermoleophilia bacterium]